MISGAQKPINSGFSNQSEPKDILKNIDLHNKVAIVTGGYSGIGLETTKALVAVGANVIIPAKRPEIANQNLNGVVSETNIIKMDLGNLNSVKNFTNSFKENFNTLSLLINNAGISMRATFEEMDLLVMKKVMDINFYGTVFCTKYALPHILKSKGSVVGVSSIAGYKGLPARTAYSASKFAMQGFLESLRIENLKKGLHVLIACPGFTASNIRNTALSKDGKVQIESPRDESKMMTAEKVAEYIYDAVVNRQNSIVLTINGKLTVLLNKLLPSLVDRLVYNHLKKEPNSPF